MSGKGRDLIPGDICVFVFDVLNDLRDESKKEWAEEIPVG